MNQVMENLVATLNEQNIQKADYVLNPSKHLFMKSDGTLWAEGTNGKAYEGNDILHQGMAEKLAIPYGYYKRMRGEKPELLSHNVNAWLHSYPEGKGLLLRTFESSKGNIARAILSDRYGLLDNYDVLFAAMKAINSSGIEVEVKEAAVTDKRLYINVVAPQIEVEAERALRNYIVRDRANATSKGIIAGLTITNSEVGYGRFEVRPRAMVIRCSNGMIGQDDSFARQHLGAKMETGQVLWSEQTRQKNFELVISQVEDAVKTFLSHDYLTGMVQKIQRASEQKLEAPLEVVQNVTREIGSRVLLSEADRKAILDSFIGGGDTHASGVFNALTYHAQTLDMDRRYELEGEAFSILPRIAGFDKPSLN